MAESFQKLNSYKKGKTVFSRISNYIKQEMSSVRLLARK